MKITSITEAIGNTPLLEIPAHVHGIENFTLYAKLELLNPFGSVKDRTAQAMLSRELAASDAQQPDVVELSSGNTAKALAVLASLKGLQFRSITNRMKVPEVKDLLLFLGAHIDELPGQSECLDPSNADDPLTVMYQQLCAEGGEFVHTNQYFNSENTRAHAATTGPEILRDLGAESLDYFFGAVGTSGSSHGCAQVLREAYPDLQVVGLVGEKGDFLPGIRNIDEVHAVGLFEPAIYQHIQAIGAQDAIDGLLVLARRCGVLAGPTSGAAYQGTLDFLRTHLPSDGVHRTGVFIACDRLESYMSYLKTRRPELFGMPQQSHALPAIQPDDVATAPSIAAADVADFQRRHDAIVVDLRSSMAYKNLRIPGSMNIVDSLFAEVLRGGLPFDPHQKVLLVCPVGERARHFAAICHKLGHGGVHSVEGGLVAWRDAGLELVRGGR